MKIAYILLATAAVVGTPAWANKELAQKNDACLACHAVDKKLVGPAYQDIAKKYSSQKDAEAMLAQSIKAGGSGKWGLVQMPPQPGLTEAEATTLAAWILNGVK